MKGVIFNILEEIVTDQFGPDTWDDLLDTAGLAGAYTSLGNYDDAQMSALVAAAGEALDLPADDVLRFVGRHAFAPLAQRYPAYPAGMTSSRGLLHQLNDVIHPQVLSLYPGANPPVFVAEDRSSNELVLRYTSDRQLCHLAEGLALGATEAFGEEATVCQEECRLSGANECRIVVTYDRADD
jgi:hypothetical protein